MHAQRMPPHITTPFDDSAAMRLRRMGLLTPDGTPDESIIRPLAYVSAGLYYDQRCDSVPSKPDSCRRFRMTVELPTPCFKSVLMIPLGCWHFPVYKVCKNCGSGFLFPATFGLFFPARSGYLRPARTIFGAEGTMWILWDATKRS